MTTARPGTVGSAGERILDTAFRLFYAHGPRGGNPDTVAAEPGVAKATPYKHFPRKDDLILAYLDRVDQAWFGGLRRRPHPHRRRLPPHPDLTSRAAGLPRRPVNPHPRPRSPR